MVGILHVVGIRVVAAVHMTRARLVGALSRGVALASGLVLASASGAAAPSTPFSNDAPMSVGVYYYPEQWAAQEWDRDIARIADLGFDFVHLAEFSWAALEPSEGHFDFHWLDQVVEIAARHHLKVLLGTPSAAPPIWLTQAHPEVLAVNDSGTIIRHGSRQQGSWASGLYRDYVRRIDEQMARHFGHNPAVWGWQVDNEPSHYANAYEYGPDAQRDFRQWLERKYHSIDALNATWGNAFWSQTYTEFAQIRIPNERELNDRPNPHAMLDFRRFTSAEGAQFVNLQASWLRQSIESRQWITSNFFAGPGVIDPHEADGLNFPCFTMYPVHGDLAGAGTEGFRLGVSTDIGYTSDLYRNMSGVTGIMELQPGQINWGDTNPQPYPGAIRLWIWHAFAAGNRFVATYRYRQPLSGIEQYHHGIVEPDGTTLARGGTEYVQAMRELKELRGRLDPSAPLPAAYAARRAAILLDFNSALALDYQPQSKVWNTDAQVAHYYHALQRLGAPVDVITERAAFERYPVLIVPAFELLDAALVERWRRYVEAGGQLIVTARTGQKDRENHLWAAPFATPILPLIGARSLYFDTPPVGLWAHVTFDQQTFAWRQWGDVLTPAGADVWASYSDQFYGGSAAVLHRALGKGSVTYIGVATDDGSLETKVLRRVYREAGISALDLPDGLVLLWRAGVWIALNYASEPQDAPAPAGVRLLLGERRLPPAGVAVWADADRPLVRGPGR